uniref:Uncharacterized protein n=1 Tax=Romanomermis culicivorax TaxID=13658 RepID=A0A915HMX2_ROMCU
MKQVEDIHVDLKLNEIHFAVGEKEHFSPIEIDVSFCIHKNFEIIGQNFETQFVENFLGFLIVGRERRMHIFAIDVRKLSQ